MRAHVVDGLLHVDDLCLFHGGAPATTTRDALQSLARLARASVRSADGRRYPCSGDRLSPADALHVLCAAGCACAVEERADVRAAVAHVDGAYVVDVARPWSPAALVRVDDDGAVADHHEILRPADAARGFRVRVVHAELPVPLWAPAGNLLAVVETPRHVLRLHHLADADASGVYVYRDGVLAAHDPLPDGSGLVLVDERHDGDAPPALGGIAHATCGALGEVILTAVIVRVARASPRWNELMTRVAAAWRRVLAETWPRASPTDLVDLLRRADTPDAYALCVDPRLLCERHAPNERIDALGTAIARRLQSTDAARFAEWRAAVDVEFRVARVDVLPIPRRRFARLHALGVFEGYVDACADGVLLGDAPSVLAVPMDARPEHLTAAILALLVRGEEAPPVSSQVREFRRGALYQEDAPCCAASETLAMRRVSVDALNGVVVLAPDGEDRRSDDRVLGVDELEGRALPSNPARTRREDVAALFPDLARRLSTAHASELVGALREVQARRACREWTLDALDAGGNASSLGLSVLLVLALTLWMGVHARVAQSRRTGAAMVAVRLEASSESALVDPCRTLRNFFALAPELAALPGPRELVRAGVVVEVRLGGRWHVGHVRAVEADRGSMLVQVAHNQTRLVLDVQSHAWRRVGSEGSDADRILRPLLEERARAVTARRRSSV